MTSQHSRRALLRGIAAASALIGSTTVVGACAQPVENPALLALGEQFAQAETVFKAADARKHSALAEYHRLSPARPDELYGRYDAIECVQEIDIEGNGVSYPDGPSYYRPVIHVSHLKSALAHYRPRSAAHRLAKRLLPIAERYEAGIESAKTRSDVIAALDDWSDAVVRLESVVGKIAGITARTKGGLLIKARALAVLSKVSEPHQFRASVTIGPSLAKDILTIVA